MCLQQMTLSVLAISIMLHFLRIQYMTISHPPLYVTRILNNVHGRRVTVSSAGLDALGGGEALLAQLQS
jgi:hypothetical protein